MDWSTLLSPQRLGKKVISNENSSRSAFEQDYDRIIFSHPFRRLQDKTQVFPLPEHDFVHTRLTHSLEVSSVGRSLGRKVGKAIMQRYPELKKQHVTEFNFGAVVAAASLAHDLGNPPFGHAGENAISEFFTSHEKGQFFKDLVSKNEWADLCHFEGNAQGFRILTNSHYEGLKLTYATLAAFTKYPRPSVLSNPDKQRKSQKKFGFFETEKEVFKSVAKAVGLISINHQDVWRRHPLTFLVEAADDICYLIIDLEDGCRLGLVTFDQTLELLAGILGDKLDRQKLHTISDLNEKLGILRALTIGILIEQVCECYLDNEKEIMEGKYDTALTDSISSSKFMAEISKVSIEKIYQSKQVVEIEAAGYEVLPGLLSEFCYAAIQINDQKDNGLKNKFRSLSKLFSPRILEMIKIAGQNNYLKLRLCLDFISGMTDRYALSTYRKIKGISMPG